MNFFTNFLWLTLSISMAATYFSGGAPMRQSSFPTQPSSNSIYIPTVTNSNPTTISKSNPAIHAVRVQYNDYSKSRAEVAGMQDLLQKAHVNMVGLAAGRVEWAYFKWAAHPEYISGDVKDTGVDFLADDSARYGQFASINAVIDVLSPSYIQAHPGTAAINALGQINPNLVGTMELVNGAYGQLLLQQVQYIAANYPHVNSISITELSYRLDGYGPQELTSYKAYSGKADWPRLSTGQINIDETSIGSWRTHILGAYFDKLTAAAHAYGKQLFLDVCLNPNHLNWEGNEMGTRYDLMLTHVDKLIVWGYYYLENYPPEFLETASQLLTKYGSDRIIMSIGMWGPNNAIMPADLFSRGLQASAKGGIPNMWVTPSIYMNADLWTVLDNYWK
jgi:hypothetical protein